MRAFGPTRVDRSPEIVVAGDVARAPVISAGTVSKDQIVLDDDPIDVVDPYPASIVIEGVVVELDIAVGVRGIPGELDGATRVVVDHVITDGDPMR